MDQPMDRQALFEAFLQVIQTPPAPPEYLAEAPSEATPFDPYQMVAEWIALRHEVKQQGKLLQATQSTLQQSLEQLRAEQTQAQPAAPAPLAEKSDLLPLDQKKLWRDLLNVLDGLDQAYAHWQNQLDELTGAAPGPTSAAPPGWQRWLLSWWQEPSPKGNQAVSMDTWREMLISNQQGIDLIRRSLLEVLKQHQIVPILARGKPFNPQTMYAVGRQGSALPENTVIQEVVRGYWWGDRILREAQVIVAAPESAS